MPDEMDNIPEFSEGATEYDRLKAHYDRLIEQEQARHGKVMFANGIVEGLRQAIYAIENDRKEIQPSRNWPGMNCAIAAIERAIDRQTRLAGLTDYWALAFRPESIGTVEGLLEGLITHRKR